MKREKLIILPKLHGYNGDMSKRWFIFFSYRNPRTCRMQRFRIYTGFSLINNKSDRYTHADKLIKDYSERLRNGWNPFEEDAEVIYTDQLQYSNLAKIYGNQKKSNLTISVFLSQFLEKIKPTIRDETFHTYASKLRIFSLWLEYKKQSDVDLGEITNQHILDFFDYLIQERKSSKVTVLKYKQILHSFFDDLMKKGRVFRNPVYDIPKGARQCDWGPKPIPENFIQILKEELKADPQLWLASQFQFYCFIRPGELRQMRIKHINIFLGIVSLPGTITKNKKDESVTIPRQFLQVLIQEYKLQEYNPDFYVFGKNYLPGPEMLGKNNMRFRFNRYRKSLGLPMDFKFYSWKHTGAVAASVAGIPVKDIQMQMRHHSLDVTDRYLRKMKGIDSKALKDGFPTI